MYGWVVGGGGRGRLYTYRYTQNDFCIKMRSHESHFNVFIIVRDKVTRQCPQTATFEEKGEPKQIRTEVPLLTSPNALPLGQTGSQKGVQLSIPFITRCLPPRWKQPGNVTCMLRSLLASKDKSGSNVQITDIYVQIITNYLHINTNYGST